MKPKTKTIANAISLLLMLAMITSLFALPFANAQEALIMNLPGSEGQPHPVMIHTEVDIDLNGGPGAGQDVELWIKYPGRPDFTYIDTYTTRSNGDLDVYDFDFNETGDFECQWRLPAPSTEVSNIEIARVVLEWPPALAYAYIGATPNPIGVGQEVLLHVGITHQLGGVQYGWEGLSVTVTKPDGTTETISGIRTDATGGTGVIYVPSMVGNYTLQTHFPEQPIPITSAGTPAGTRMLATDSDILTLVVQEEPREYYQPHSLPTEYWTRPIDAQIREWSPIAGSWLVENPPNLFAPYNDDAPDTAHVLWKKPFTEGGLAGGTMGDHAMDCGDAYEGKFEPRKILNGKLYYTVGPYERPRVTYCVDLHTGEELWAKVLRTEDGDTIDFCQLIYWDSYNYHAVFEYLWITSGSTWYGYDAFTGEQITQYDNVPSGSNIYGEKGEIYRYSISLSQARMTLWNQSAMVSLQGSWGSANDNRVGSRALDAGSGSRYERAWALNISIPEGLPGSVREVKLGDRVVGNSVTQSEVVTWGFSLKPGSEGQLLFKKTWNAPAEWDEGKLTVGNDAGSIDAGILTVGVKETREHYAFSTETGELLWGPTEPEHYLDIYNYGRYTYIGYDIYFSVGMSGIINAYDCKTGELLWKYATTDPYTEILWSDNWPMQPQFITDGKIYLGHEEHSPVDPKPRGAPYICLNATTGEEIWRIDGLARQTFWGGHSIIGDSIIATQDSYSQCVYAIGKGPSATIVSAPDVGIELGKSVLVRGTVTDVSPGTKDDALKMRFPNGVPAVSDESMSDWMLYVYKQFDRPADAVGVEVVVSVLDPNNNVYEIGTATSDEDGFFSVAFTPEVPGKYTVIASFAGSGAYYGSHAKTAINVEEAPAATPEPTPMPASAADLYLVPGIAGIIVAIAVVGAIIVLMLRKR
jgi:outer membrane protein assembly factor BamB